jgi:hypothetical protein
MHTENKDNGDFSPYDEFLDVLFSDERTNEDVPESEFDAIHSVLEKLSDKYSIGFEVYGSDNLNSRLGNLSSIFYFSEEISLALQSNTMNDALLGELYAKLTSEVKLNPATEEELESMTRSLAELAAYIELDPEAIFLDNPNNKYSLLHTLVSALRVIQQALEDKPEKDKEQLLAKAYLIRNLNESMSTVRTNFGDDYQQIEQVYEKDLIEIFIEINKIPESALVSRFLLDRILVLVSELHYSTASNRLELIRVDKVMEDIKISIQDIISDYS